VGIAPIKESISKKGGAKNFRKAEIKLNVGKMGSEPGKDPDNPCNIRKRVLRALDTSGY